jgi:putative RecB family exonuclease
MSAVDRLSPSKISAFRQCPQHFAFRYIDRLAEPEDPWMFRGTLVHAVCERLFDLPPEQRTRANAVELLHRLWEGFADADPALSEMFTDAEQATAWLTSAEVLLATWFRLEEPAAITVDGTEVFIETPTDAAVRSGIIDRLDRRPDGTWAITDYKTGPAPGPRWELAAFFQLRFYALVVTRSLGLDVTLLRLVHLARDGEVLELPFDADGAETVDRQVTQLAAAMRRAVESGRWHANVGRQCDWCAFREICPGRLAAVQKAAEAAAITPQLTTTA